MSSNHCRKAKRSRATGKVSQPHRLAAQLLQQGHRFGQLAIQRLRPAQVIGGNLVGMLRKLRLQQLHRLGPGATPVLLLVPFRRADPAQEVFHLGLGAEDLAVQVARIPQHADR